MSDKKQSGERQAERVINRSQSGARAARCCVFSDSALESQISLPEAAVCRTAGHGPQQVGRDLDDLLDGSASDVLSHGSARVDRDDHPVLEHEAQRRRAVVEFDGRVQSGLVRRGHHAVLWGEGHRGQIAKAKAARGESEAIAPAEGEQTTAPTVHPHSRRPPRSPLPFPPLRPRAHRIAGHEP